MEETVEAYKLEVDRLQVNFISLENNIHKSVITTISPQGR